MSWSVCLCPLRLYPQSLQYSRTCVNTYSLCPNSTQSLCLAEGRREARRLLCTFNKQLSHRAPWGCSWGDTVGWGCCGSPTRSPALGPCARGRVGLRGSRRESIRDGGRGHGEGSRPHVILGHSGGCPVPQTQVAPPGGQDQAGRVTFGIEADGPGVPGQGGLGVHCSTWNLVAFSERLCPRGLRGLSGRGRCPYFRQKVSLDAGVTCVRALPVGPGTSLISWGPLQSSSSQRHCPGS